MSNQTKDLRRVGGTTNWGGVREGAGRPKKHGGEKTLAVRMNTVTYMRIKAMADKTGVSMSDWARTVMVAALIGKVLKG